jgi:hypothetical protein
MSERILIAGDWTIDESLFLNKYYSKTSSHTGGNHYIISNNNEGESGSGNDLRPKLSLCAAGHVARMLILHDKKKDHKIYIGMGSWHKDDKPLIKKLLCRSADTEEIEDINNWFVDVGPSINSSRILKSDIPITESDKIEMINLAGKPNEQITRLVFRQYGYDKEGNVIQISRVDRVGKYTSFLSVSNEGKIKDVTKVIIFDRGGEIDINKELIEQLVRCPKTPSWEWYVRSKDRKALWLRTLRENVGKNDGKNDGKFKLLLLGPEIISDLNPTKTLFTKNKKHIMPDIFKEMQLYENEIDTLVLVSYTRQIIIKIKDHVFFAYSEKVPENQLGYLAWTSSLFALLIIDYSVLIGEIDRSIEEEKEKEREVEKILNKVDDFTRNPYVKAKSLKMKAVLVNDGWGRLKKNYEEATQGDLGIIYDKDTGTSSSPKVTTSVGPELKLSYAFSSIDGYIACIKEKKQAIDIMARGLKEFRDNPLNSVSYLVQADPGSGKTFLAKKIADNFDFDFLKFDITQMVCRDDLVELFDRISNKQASDRAKPVLVLVDEVNVLLNSDPVYSAFLAPIEAGEYKRREGTFNLQPCAWIFLTTETDNQNNPKNHKYDDFRSRITDHIKIDYQSLIDNNRFKTKRIKREAKLEQVYYGATMISKFFPGVHEVSKKILKCFQEFNPEKAPFREIRNAVKYFNNVHDKIDLSNCCDPMNKKIKRCSKNDDCKYKKDWKNCEESGYAAENGLQCPGDKDDGEFVNIIPG